MCKADVAFGVYDAVQGHTSQLEEIDFLPVRSRNRMVRIRKPDKRDPFIFPVLLKDRQSVLPDRQDFRPTAGELLILITPARQLRAAIRSHKTTQKRENDRLPTKIRQANPVALEIMQFEIGSQLAWCNQFRHSLTSFSNFTVAATVCFCSPARERATMKNP